MSNHYKMILNVFIQYCFRSESYFFYQEVNRDVVFYTLTLFFNNYGFCNTVTERCLKEKSLNTIVYHLNKLYI